MNSSGPGYYTLGYRCRKRESGIGKQGCLRDKVVRVKDIVRRWTLS